MRTVIEELQRALVSVEAGPAFRPGAGFADRTAALERLEVHVFDRLAIIEEHAPLPPESRAVVEAAIELRRRLQAANEHLLETLRGTIRSGSFTPAALTRELLAHAGARGDQGHYDALDVLVEGLLDAGPPSEERAEREAEMVYYQPSPARAVLALIARAVGPHDVFCDLGSGLGRVVILVALLSRARAIGIEIEPAYCDYAQRCVSQLNVPHVELLRADARDAPLTAGTVFFMYTPFRGAILRRVLDRLALEARTRQITVCTFGSCTAEVARERWLRPEAGRALEPDEVAVFRSV